MTKKIKKKGRKKMRDSNFDSMFVEYDGTSEIDDDFNIECAKTGKKLHVNGVILDDDKLYLDIVDKDM